MEGRKGNGGEESGEGGGGGRGVREEMRGEREKVRIQLLKLLESCPIVGLFYCSHNFVPSVCAGDSQLTESRKLLSLSSITASSETSDDPVEDLVDRSFFTPSAWCSTQAFSEAPYVQLNFSSDVTLSYMEARGAITGFSYVTEFQLEIFDERSGNFTQYGVTDEPTVSGSVC